MSQTYAKVDLYGGAITVSLPTSFTDVSALRTIPSHQEVYISLTSPTSIIFDILTRAEPPTHPCPTDASALEYHYSDIISAGHGRIDADADNDEVPEETTVMGGGVAKVPKLPHHTPALRTLRIQRPTYKPPTQPTPQPTPQTTTTANTHTPTHAHTNMHTSHNKPLPDFTGILLTLIRLEPQRTDLLVAINVPHVPGEYEYESVDLHAGRVGKLLEEAGEVMDFVLESFEVVDWGLFVEEEEG